MDPITIGLIGAGATTLAGLLGNWIKSIKSGRSQKRGNIARGIGKDYNPTIFSNEDMQIIQTLPPQYQKMALKYAQEISKNPEEFLKKFPSIDTDSLTKIINQDLPTGEQLGFEQLQNYIPELMQGTEFGPIENLAREKFQQETIPTLAERFAGAGGLNSSALIGQLGKAGSNLESQLAALRSQYGLQRAGTLGSLAQGQQQLGLSRSQSIADLGMKLRGQQFGQQKDLANLGLAQNEQELARRQQGLSLLPQLMQQSQYSPVKRESMSGSSQLTQLGAGIGGKLLPYAF